MIPLKTAAELWSLLPLAGAGLIFALFGLAMYTVGWAVGKNRGYAQAPDKLKGEWRDEQQKRLVAEGLLAAEKRVSGRLEATLNTLTAQPESNTEPRLRRVQ